jgi:hypothetical protein
VKRGNTRGLNFQRCPRGVLAKRASGDKATQSLLQGGLSVGQGDTWDNKDEFQKKSISVLSLFSGSTLPFDL